MSGKIRTRSNQRGAALLYAVFAITAVAVLGTGIYFLTTTSTFSGLSANDRNRAYQLALTGKDFAVTKNLENTGGRDFTKPNGDKLFHLEIKNDEITSTGFVKAGTPYEARQTIFAKILGFKSWADTGFAKDIQAFTKPVESKAGLITTDTTAGSVSLGKITTGGAAWDNNFGALWYRGNAAQGDCIDGRCRFGTGFRAFFAFQINASAAGADGFTFTVFNGDAASNDAFSVGGDTDKGELMGFAGDSRLMAGGYLDGTTRIAASCPTPLGCAAGRGIQPPKMAVEFDAKANNDPAAGVCDPDSRNDEPDPDPPPPNPPHTLRNFKNHMALMFWGDNNTSYGATVCDPTLPVPVGLNTYDDNLHSAGGGSNESISNAPNPSQPSFNRCYYFDGNQTCPPLPVIGWPGNWLLNPALPNIYAFRIEVGRKLTPETSGSYKYALRVWVKRCNSGDPMCLTDYPESSEFANTKKDYLLDNPIDTPILHREIEISPAYHLKFDTFFFGWTTATGSSTQEILLSRFRMNFRK
jgi:hypothetical protein